MLGLGKTKFSTNPPPKHNLVNRLEEGTVLANYLDKEILIFFLSFGPWASSIFALDLFSFSLL